jgi:hypothetical protein
MLAAAVALALRRVQAARVAAETDQVLLLGLQAQQILVLAAVVVTVLELMQVAQVVQVS